MKLRRILALLLASMFIFTACGDGDDEAYRIVKLIEYSGQVSYTRDDKTKDVYKNMNFENGDILETKEQSSASLSLDGNKTMTLSENTILEMKAEGDKDNTRTTINLKAGEIVNELTEPLKSGELYEIRTSNASVGVKGTTFLVRAEKDKTIIYCDTGVVEVKSDDKTEILTAQQGAIVENDTIEIVDKQQIVAMISDTSIEVLPSLADVTGNSENFGVTNLPEGYKIYNSAYIDENTPPYDTGIPSVLPVADSGRLDKYAVIAPEKPNEVMFYDEDGYIVCTVGIDELGKAYATTYTIDGNIPVIHREMTYEDNTVNLTKTDKIYEINRNSEDVEIYIPPVENSVASVTLYYTVTYHECENYIDDNGTPVQSIVLENKGDFIYNFGLMRDGFVTFRAQQVVLGSEGAMSIDKNYFAKLEFENKPSDSVTQPPQDDSTATPVNFGILNIPDGYEVYEYADEKFWADNPEVPKPTGDTYGYVMYDRSQGKVYYYSEYDGYILKSAVISDDGVTMTAYEYIDVEVPVISSKYYYTDSTLSTYTGYDVYRRTEGFEAVDGEIQFLDVECSYQVEQESGTETIGQSAAEVTYTLKEESGIMVLHISYKATLWGEPPTNNITEEYVYKLKLDE